MPSSSTGRWSLLTLAIVGLGACSANPTSVLLKVRAAAGLAVPDHLHLSVFADAGRVVHEHRLPERGSPDLPSAVVLYPRETRGRLRVLLHAMDSSDVVSGEGAGSVELEPEAQVELTVTLSGGRLPDHDHDGVPDTIDNCPAAPNPEQGPCGGETGIGDASPDDRGVDATSRDGPPPDAPADAGPPPPYIVTAGGWGQRAPATPPVNLNDVWGTSATNVWVVGDQGTALHFNGQHWTSHATGTTNNLYAVWSASPAEVWTVGEGGTVLHYDGAAWSTTPVGLTATLTGVWGSSPSDIWVVGAKALLHYDGASWTGASAEPKYEIDDVQGLSATAVWAATRRGGDSDGVTSYDGASWTEPPVLGEPEDMHAVWPLASQDVWVAGKNGTAAHFDSASWTTEATGTNAELWGLWGDASAVWAVGGNGTILRRDSAGGWTPLPSGTTATLRGVWGSGPTQIWTVGDNGTLLRFDGTSWTTAIPNSGPALSAQLRGVWVGPTGEIWTVGDNGTILGFAADGTWTTLNSVGNTTLYGIWGNGHDDIWAVGAGGAVFHYQGGTTWDSVDTGDNRTLYGVWGSGPDDIWAVGGYSYTCSTTTCQAGRVLHSDGNGWSVTDVGNKYLYAVWGSGPSDIWAVGAGGAIRHKTPYNDWGSLPSPASVTLYGIWGASPATIWAVGASGTILTYDGTVWNKEPTASPNHLRGVWGHAGAIWIVGDGGTILASAPGGWVSLASGAAWSNLNAIHGNGSDDLWVVGTLGTRLHFDDSWP